MQVVLAYDLISRFQNLKRAVSIHDVIVLNPSCHLWKKYRQEHPAVVSTEVELYQLSTKHAGGDSHMFPFLQTLIFDIVHLYTWMTLIWANRPLWALGSI